MLGRDRWRRAWVPGIPLGLTALWYLLRSHFVPVATAGEATAQAVNLLVFPNFAARSAAAVVASVSGLDFDFSPSATSPRDFDPSLGLPLLVALLLVTFLRVRRAPPTRTLWTCISVLLSFWLLASLIVGGERVPELGRYVYPAAPITFLALAEIFRGVRPSPAAVAAILVAAVLALGANLYDLRGTGEYLRAWSGQVRADLTAIELARAHVRPSFVPTSGEIGDPIFAGSVTARKYLAAANRNGSFADTVSELAAAPESDRQEADRVLAEALGLKLTLFSRPPGSRCRTVDGSGFRLPRGGATLRSMTGGTVSVRRFGYAFAGPFAINGVNQPQDYTASVGTLAPRRFEALRIPRDAAPQPWYGQIAGGGPVTVCPFTVRSP
jgi:hypothetical protein